MFFWLDDRLHNVILFDGCSFLMQRGRADPLFDVGVLRRAPHVKLQVLFPLASFEVLAANHAEDTILYYFSIRQEVCLLVVEVHVKVSRRRSSNHSWDWLERVTYQVSRRRRNRSTVNWTRWTVVVNWIGLRGRTVDWWNGIDGRGQVGSAGDWWRLQIGRLWRRSDVDNRRRTVISSRGKGVSLLDRYLSCRGLHLFRSC